MNAVDPLAELRPLHLPGPVNWWPPAPGWWVLAILVIALALWLCRYFYRVYTQGAIRRQALTELDALLAAADHRSVNSVLCAINQLLKRVALHSYPRREVAPLSGSAWLAFLDRCSNSTDFTRGAGKALAETIYRRDAEADLSALGELCRQWIRSQA